MIKMIIKGKLRTLTAFHTGSGAAEFHTDMALAKDGEGNYYIPGTTLAGALRDYLNRSLGSYKAWYDATDEKEKQKLARKMPEDIIVKKLFGYQNNDDGHASALLVEDAPAVGDVKVSVRDHVVIIRETGSAAPGLKFDREVVQAGSEFAFRMEIDFKNMEEKEQLLPYIGYLVQTLKNGDIRLGGATSRGLGAVKLHQIKIFEWDLTEKENFEKFLQFQVNDNKIAPNVMLKNLPNPKKINPEPFAVIKLKCGIEGPFMIKSGAVDESDYPNPSADEKIEAPDMVCLRETNAFGEDVFVIPGSSIKGAFRAQAERIIKQCQGKNDSHRWLKPFKDDDGKVNLKKFGEYLKKRQERGIEPPEVESCFGDAEEGQGAFIFTDAYFEPKPDLTKVTNHVAIDPLTGGAIDSALYSMDAIWDDENAEFCMTLRVQRPELWQLGLLGHLLWDLHDGRIRLGFGKARGMGRVKIKEINSIRGRLPELTKKGEVVEFPITLTDEARHYLNELSDAFNKKMEEGRNNG
ncbi:MAG: hypothetical protein Kow0037_18300 [Calditrichia bacterium]